MCMMHDDWMAQVNTHLCQERRRRGEMTNAVVSVRYAASHDPCLSMCCNLSLRMSNAETHKALRLRGMLCSWIRGGVRLEHHD